MGLDQRHTSSSCYVLACNGGFLRIQAKDPDGCIDCRHTVC